MKKYTYDKFFIYVVSYFILINFINLIYLKNINLFTFQSLFSVIILFVHSALYRSVSVKIIVYLYLKKTSVDINSFYKTEFKEKSFNKRVKILVDNGYLIKKNKYLKYSKKGEFDGKKIKTMSLAVFIDYEKEFQGTLDHRSYTISFKKIRELKDSF